jgi:F0F1-type ATP synthase membrane subunit c/vacuolar-type H+-ATPase subunit K
MKKQTVSGSRQKGISTIGIIAVVGIFGLLIVTFLKVFPMYYGNFKVQSALEALQQDSRVDPKSKRSIWESLQKRLYIDEVKNIKLEHVTMVRKDGKTTVTVTYETRDTFMGNLFIGGAFSESVVIDR